MYITIPPVNPVDESTLSVFLANSLLCITPTEPESTLSVFLANRCISLPVSEPSRRIYIVSVPS